MEASVEAEAASCVIQVSRYDHSCSVDSDCVGLIAGFRDDLGTGGLPVQSGNYCKAMCVCGGEAISKTAVAQYAKDVSATPLGSGAIAGEACGCVNILSPCCQNGQCVVDQCAQGTSIDAGTTSVLDASSVDGSVLCGLKTGPLDSGSAGTDPTRWCMPQEVCTQFNGGWACCTVQGTGGISICVTPIEHDGG
jgi:hypothetical protein